MGVYIEVQELVWNKYRVLGVESEEELKNLMEYYGHNNVLAYEENLDMEYQALSTKYDSLMQMSVLPMEA